MKIGFFIPNLGNNQIAIDTIAGVNTIVNNHPNIFPSIFYKEIEPSVIRPKTIATSFDKLYHYYGTIVTVNLDTTWIALQSRTIKSIYFYVYDLEWTRNIGSYMPNIQLYRHPKVELICPSKEYAEAIENYCNRQVKYVIPGLNLDEIITTIRS